MNNIYLQYAGRCSEIGMKWYSLSERVPREMWVKISEYFEKFGEDEEDGELSGWLTAQPEVVEKILGVREELTLEYRRREAEKRREEKKKKHWCYKRKSMISKKPSRRLNTQKRKIR